MIGIFNNDLIHYADALITLFHAKKQSEDTNFKRTSGKTMNRNASSNAAGSHNAHKEEATILYVLKLESNKCCVDSTNNLDQRFAEHLGGKGSA